MKFFWTLIFLPIYLCFAAKDSTGQYCITTLKSGLHGVFRDASGKIIQRTPLGKNALVVDTNLLISREMSKFFPKADNESRAKWANKLNKLLKNRSASTDDSHLYIAEKTAMERFSGNSERFRVFPEKTRIFEIEVPRSSADYQSVLKKIEDLEVGQIKPRSENDRQIVADLFFAKKNYKSDNPSFLTADAGIYGPLCKLNPLCLKLNNDKKKIKDAFPDGFDASLEISGIVRTIRVIPF